MGTVGDGDKRTVLRARVERRGRERVGAEIVARIEKLECGSNDPTYWFGWSACLSRVIAEIHRWERGTE